MVGAGVARGVVEEEEEQEEDDWAGVYGDSFQAAGGSVTRLDLEGETFGKGPLGRDGGREARRARSEFI